VTKIIDEDFKRLAEQLSKEDQIRVLGSLIWLSWREKLHLPLFDFGAPPVWAETVFCLIGLVYVIYLQVSSWWSDLQINWVFRMMVVK